MIAPQSENARFALKFLSTKMRAIAKITNAAEITPTTLITGRLKIRHATAELSNTFFFKYGKATAVRLTTRNEIVKPRNPEIGPSRWVNAYSASQISPPITETRMAQCGEWYRSFTSPSHSGATLAWSIDGVAPPTKNAIANTHPNSRIVSKMLFDPMAVRTFTNGGAASL